MTESPDGADAAIAAELRSIAAALHERSPAAGSVDAVLEHLRAAHELFADGERRIRWYEATAEDPPGSRARNRELSPWSGVINASAPPMTLEVGEHESGVAAMIGRVRIDRLREGPPGSVHGGVVAGLFDEVLGAASRLSGIEGTVTGRLVVRFRKPTPLDTPLRFRAWIDDHRSTRVSMRADCCIESDEGEAPSLTAEADAIFVRLGLGIGGSGDA